MKKQDHIKKLLAAALVAVGASVCATPLPNNLRSGINVPYVYGDLNWAVYWSSAQLGADGTPYPEQRVENLLQQEGPFEENAPHKDFVTIMGAGFGHIRIGLDPWAIGLTESGGAAEYAVDPNHPAILSLKKDIRAAWEVGLMTIVDFHPTVVAPGDWRMVENSFMTLTETSLTSFNKPYHGTYKYRFLQGPGSLMHPLVIFWRSMNLAFQDMDMPIAFQIMNEPFEGCYKPGPDNLYALKGMHGSTISTYSQSLAWILSQRSYWREIVRLSVREIESSNRFVIVNGASAQVGDFNSNNLSTPFSQAEVAHPDRVIYAFHVYPPAKFTHTKIADWATSGSPTFLPSPLYDKDRDFLPNGGSPYPDTSDNPFTPQIEENSVQQQLDKVREWSEANGLPKLMVTEFGAIKRDVNLSIFPSAGPTGERAGPGDSIARHHWAYDVRKYVETQGWGWTWYGLTGDFGYYKGEIQSSYNEHGYWDEVGPFMEAALFGARMP